MAEVDIYPSNPRQPSNPYSMLLHPQMGALPQSAVDKYDTLTNTLGPDQPLEIKWE